MHYCALLCFTKHYSSLHSFASIALLCFSTAIRTSAQYFQIQILHFELHRIATTTNEKRGHVCLFFVFCSTTRSSNQRVFYVYFRLHPRHKNTNCAAQNCFGAVIVHPQDLWESHICEMHSVQYTIAMPSNSAFKASSAT